MDELLRYAVYFLIGTSAFLAAEALFLFMSRRMSYGRQVNARLRLSAGMDDQRELLVQLRRARGLTGGGQYMLPLVWFNRLVLQSGVGLGLTRLVSLMTFAGGGGFALVLHMQGRFLMAILAGLAAGLAIPVLALLMVRRRRRRTFEAQLPEAVDVVVRSLRAGHPLPVAIAMVGKEMPDPIGSEFGITADELTYGLGLEEAVENLSARVGQEDLTLVVVAIAIQSRTGGNLSEILSNLSRVIRARFKMRRRIKALSAEGRFSALALSVLPFLVFFALSVFAPNFYGEVWHDPATQKILAIAIGVMMVGNLIMYRMVNFKL